MKTIFILLMLSYSVLAQVTGRVEWGLSVNPDVDKVVIVTWIGDNPIDNTIYEDSSYLDINVSSLLSIDTLNLFDLAYNFTLPTNGQYVKVGGAYLNTSGLDSPLKASIIIQLPNTNRPFKMDYINFILQ